MKIEKMLAAVNVCAAFVVIPTVAGAAPVTRGTGAVCGEHVWEHARDIGGFSGHMNPSDHRGFSGHGEHHCHHLAIWASATASSNVDVDGSSIITCTASMFGRWRPRLERRDRWAELMSMTASSMGRPCTSCS